MGQPQPKTDQNGWQYYDQLPDGYRIATMDDFHVNGSKRLGMEYLIQRGDKSYWEVHRINEQTRAINLKLFLDHRMVFVKG